MFDIDDEKEVEETADEKRLRLTHDKLKRLRQRQDLALRPTKYLRQTVQMQDGTERPLKLRYYQVQAILHMLLMKRFVLGDDTGLGKTVMAIGALCYVWDKRPQEKAIVLTTKTATPQWCSEFERFTVGVRTYTAAGGKAVREAAYKAWDADVGPAVLIVGYASFRNDISITQEWKGFILVTDEATAYKNLGSRTHQVVAHIASNASRVWALTATLIKNDLMEGHGIYRVVQPGLFPNANDFMHYYAKVEYIRVGGNRRVPKILGYMPDKVKEFRECIDPYFLGRPKHEVASELPVLTIKALAVSMTKAQAEKYNEALTGILTIGTAWTRPKLLAMGLDELQQLAALAGIEGLEHAATADALLEEGSVQKETTKLTQIIYCQQIVDHLNLIDCEGDSGKYKYLLDLLSEGDLAGEKVIIFSRFRKMVDLAMEGMAKKKVKAVRITGAESLAQRMEAQRLFQDHNSGYDKIFITMAAGEAINLQSASTIVFYDSPWSAGDYLQILGRMIRIGSMYQRVQALHLVAANTVDARVQEVLHRKMKLLNAVLGQRLKGEKENAPEMIDARNEISDLYAALQADARGML